MPTAGKITVGGKDFEVEGLSWMDHEFSSNALGENQVGWDWLALTLNDGTDVMLYRLRDAKGQSDYLSGTIVNAKGQANSTGSCTPWDGDAWGAPV